jgi:hypothetical protein
MESSGNAMAEEEREVVEELDRIRERDEGTVAPWAIPSLSGSHSISPIASAAPLSRHSSTTSVSAGGSPYPSTSPARASPRPFTPPTLFPPKRRPSLLSLHAESNGDGEKQQQQETVADDGGAAASSSPFGVLGKASLSRAT